MYIYIYVISLLSYVDQCMLQPVEISEEAMTLLGKLVRGVNGWVKPEALGVFGLWFGFPSPPRLPQLSNKAALLRHWVALHRANPAWSHAVKELDRFLIGGIRRIHCGSLVGDIYSNFHAARLHGYNVLNTWESLLISTTDTSGSKRPAQAAKALHRTIYSHLLARAFLPGYPFATPLCQHPTVCCRQGQMGTLFPAGMGPWSSDGHREMDASCQNGDP